MKQKPAPALEAVERAADADRCETNAVARAKPIDSDAYRSGMVRKARTPARVLVVDDEKLIVDMFRRVLRGHDVHGHTNPNEALARVAAGESFDIIFCDLMMPELTGMELYRRMLSIAPGQAERVVFLSGGVFTEGARAFARSVPNRRMDKPIGPGVLRALVEEVALAKEPKPAP